MRRAVLVFVVAAACQSGSAPSTLATETAFVGEISLLVPTGWNPTVPLEDEAMPRQVWVPTKNPRKESLAVRIAPRNRERSDEEVVASAITAQGQLASAQITQRNQIATPSGASGVWIEVKYVPPNEDSTYSRSHVVLVGDEHVVHLMYTAAEPDPQHLVIQVAMDSVAEVE